MKPRTSLFSLAATLAAPVCSAAPIFSWESGLDGWNAGAPNSVVTSTTGATDGSMSLAVSQPISNMWYSTPTAVGLSVEQLQSIFTNATELKLDVSYPNPGYNSWYNNASVEIIIQGANQGWVGLGTQEVVVDAAPQTFTFPLTVAQAANMASSGWGQIVLKFTYGNGGSTSTDAVFYVDNFSNTVVADPPPASNFYWTGSVDDQWTSLNWASDAAGTVPGGALPSDGSAGVAFAATGAANLTNGLGAAQNVKSIVVTAGTGPVTIGGTHGLTVGSDGIWLEDTASGLVIDTTGEVILGTSQIWKNKSASPLVVNSVISGTAGFTKIGAGPVRLGNANTYAGGTIIEQGVLALEHADALGGATASLTVNGGSLDLNGLDVTLGALTGASGGVITNTSLAPSTLTLDTADDSSYSCAINDSSGAGPASLVKKGVATVTSSGGGNFTGPVVIEDGQFAANAWVFNVPTYGSFGNSQIAGRTITVTYPGTLTFLNSSIFGNAAADTSLLPDIFVNETVMSSAQYNQIGNITLNASNLHQYSASTGNYEGYQFKGVVKVTGTVGSSTIASNGMGNHLSSETVFEVDDVTGDALEDLQVQASLLDQSGDYGSASGGLTKTGAGTMSVAFSSYTGPTKILQGVLSLTGARFSDAGAVEIATGAVLDLNHLDTDTVGELTIGATVMSAGIYGAIGSGAQFERAEITGTGFLEIGSDPYLPWISGFTTLIGADQEKGADPDHDGMTNIEEFALDGNPENGAATGKVRSRLETVETYQVLLTTLPVRDGTNFSGTAPASGLNAADGITYEIGGSNDLALFDQTVSPVTPARTGEPEMPTLNTGWTYHTFRLDGEIDSPTPRGPKGFLRVKVSGTP